MIIFIGYKINNIDITPSMDIINFEPAKEENLSFAPVHPCRILLSGGSGCGKTNVMMNLVLRFMDWDKLYVYTKHLEQKKYVMLKEILDDVEEKAKKKLEKQNEKLIEKGEEPIDITGYELAVYGSTLDDIISPDELDGSIKNLIVIDDFINEKNQSKMMDLFSRGRHKNASILYLGQSFFQVPKMVRLNCNYFVFFGLPNKREMLEISKNIASDMDVKEFTKIFKKATEEPFSFFVIDTQTKHFPLRYRKGFDGLLTFC